MKGNSSFCCPYHGSRLVLGVAQDKVKRLQDNRTVRYEATIKVDQSQKLAKFALRGRFGERPDDLNVVFQTCNSCTADMVPEKVKRLGTKNTLVWVNSLNAHAVWD